MKVSQRHRFGAATAALASLAMLAACVVPTSALAGKTDPNQCTGIDITGQGASSNSIAQNGVWDPQFNSSTNKHACSGTQGKGGTPKVKYTNTGTGAGLESWGEFGKVTPNYGPTNAFVGTSEAFDSTTISEIESHESTPTPGTIETVPVLQIATAIIVNLPTGCTATSTNFPGRLVLSQKSLEGIFKGDITKWSQLTDGGDALSGGSCDPTTTITPVVRIDQAGPTHYLKRYLNLIDSSPLTTSKGSHTWGELSEGSLNTTWPSSLAAVTTAKKGEAEEDNTVAAKPSSIGYGNLAEIRAGGKFSKTGEGGANTQKFWVPIEAENKKGKAKYVDPADNGDVEAVSNANCKKTLYSNGSEPFPPPSVTEPWNQVTTLLSEKTYPLCGFGFVLTTTTYSLFPETQAGEAQTVHDLLSFVTDKKGGQAALLGHDYSPLPKAVASEAAVGASQIKF